MNDIHDWKNSSKKSSFELYDENKKRVNMLLENRDIDKDGVSILYCNIKSDLLNADSS